MNTTETGQPLGLGSTEGLGPRPEDVLRQQAFLILSRLQRGTEDVVRLDTALAAVAAERERVRYAIKAFPHWLGPQAKEELLAALYGPNVAGNRLDPVLRGKSG